MPSGHLAFPPPPRNKFGDGTLVFINDNSPHQAVPGAHVAQRLAQDRSSLLVLSDLHFGPDYEFLRQREVPEVGQEKKTLTDCLVEDLCRAELENDIAAVLITGDFTSSGVWSNKAMAEISGELEALSAALRIEKRALLALPGNHDVVRYPEGQDIDVAKLAVETQVAFEHERGYRFFLSELLDRDVKQPLDYVEVIAMKHADIFVGMLNSCRILATKWTEYGFVGRSGLEIIQQLEMSRSNDQRSG